VRKILIVGVPRSGTTWIGEVLGATPGTTLLAEPDNHFHVAYAWKAKCMLGLREHPSLVRGESNSRTRMFEQLWDAALSGRRRSPVADLRLKLSGSLVEGSRPALVSGALAGDIRVPARLRLAGALASPVSPPTPEHPNLIVKSVYSSLCVEWIAGRWPVEVVIVLRNPLNVVSSWLDLGWLGTGTRDVLSTIDPEAEQRLSARYGLGAPPSTPIGRAARLIGLLTCELREVANRHPQWHVAVHEDVCAAPSSRLRALTEDLGLEWPLAMDDLVEQTNRPGRAFETRRIAADLPEAWRHRLRDEEVEQVISALEGVPQVLAG
jgi:hypothetical protein